MPQVDPSRPGRAALASGVAGLVPLLGAPFSLFAVTRRGATNRTVRRLGAGGLVLHALAVLLLLSVARDAGRREHRLQLLARVRGVHQVMGLQHARTGTWPRHGADNRPGTQHFTSSTDLFRSYVELGLLDDLGPVSLGDTVVWSFVDAAGDDPDCPLLLSRNVRAARLSELRGRVKEHTVKVPGYPGPEVLMVRKNGTVLVLGPGDRWEDAFDPGTCAGRIVAP